jgi:hypothetical protein
MWKERNPLVRFASLLRRLFDFAERSKGGHTPSMTSLMGLESSTFAYPTFISNAKFRNILGSPAPSLSFVDSETADG